MNLDDQHKINNSLSLDGIHFGKIFVQSFGSAISIMISPMNGVDNPQMIALTTDQVIQLRDFLNTIVGTKKG